MMSPDPGSEGNLDFDDKVSVAAVPENFSLGKSSLYASRWQALCCCFFFLTHRLCSLFGISIKLHKSKDKQLIHFTELF